MPNLACGGKLFYTRHIIFLAYALGIILATEGNMSMYYSLFIFGTAYLEAVFILS